PVAYYLFLCIVYRLSLHLLLFSFTHTATTEIYTLSLHDALPISHQRFQNGVLPWGERDRAVSAGDPAGRRVERQIGHSQHRRLGDARPTEQGPDAREQLVEGEGLGEVIIRTGAETAHAVGDAVARGQHQDRNRTAALAEGAADREPVLPGQEPVEHDQVVLVHRGLLLAVLAGGGNVDDEALLLKPLGQEPGGFPVVLDQEESHRGLILARGRGRGAT